MTSHDAKMFVRGYLEIQDNRISEPGFSNWIAMATSDADHKLIRNILSYDQDESPGVALASDQNVMP